MKAKPMTKSHLSDTKSLSIPEDLDIIDKKTPYNGYFSIDKYTLKHRLFEGGWSDQITREVFERGHAVAVLLFDADLDQIVLVEQFRIGAYAASKYQHWQDDHSPWLLELVAGIVDDNETLEDVARREAVEEANCTIKEIVPVSHYLVSPGGTSETMAVYCGQIDASQAGGIYGLDHENEDIRVVRIDVSEAFELLDQGKILNSMTLIALQWLRLNHETLRAQWRSLT